MRLPEVVGALRGSVCAVNFNFFLRTSKLFFLIWNELYEKINFDCRKALHHVGADLLRAGRAVRLVFAGVLGEGSQLNGANVAERRRRRDPFNSPTMGLISTFFFIFTNSYIFFFYNIYSYLFFA